MINKKTNMSKKIKKQNSNLYTSNIHNKLLSAEEILSTIQDQYESLPYPYRDPEKENPNTLFDVSPTNPLEIQNYIYGGKKDFSKPFRALMAGGGTGDSTVSLAQRLHDMNCPYELVHLDLSNASQKIAAARLSKRGLMNDKVKFIQGSLLDCKEMEIGEFDYVDSCGVLHHLPDTEAGFKALDSVLKPDGGMGIMVYGTLGRTGVYWIQEMMKMLLIGGEKADEKVKLIRKLISQLPETNWMKVNRFIAWGPGTNDNEILDLFAHISDKSFKVNELCKMMDKVGLRITSFMMPGLYNPEFYLSDIEILNKINKMSKEEKWAFAELLSGHMKKHIFYIVKKENPIETLSAKDKDSIPWINQTIINVAMQQFNAGNKKITLISMNFELLKVSVTLPELSNLIIPLIDNKRTYVQEIYDQILDKNLSVIKKNSENSFEKLSTN